jgi:CRP/FNR family transcriptional regulator
MNIVTPALPEFLVNEMAASGQRARLGAGQYFFHRGSTVDVFAVLEAGALRVFATGDNGREITLYGVAPHECCLVNVLCLMSNMRSPATAVAEEDSTAVLFPKDRFLKWVDQRADVRSFVFGIMNTRVVGMMTLIEEVAFQRLDCRLATCLLQRMDAGGVVAATHEAIAGDLGTAREVVSRLLKSFEREEAVALTRGAVAVRNRAFLERLAGGRS